MSVRLLFVWQNHTEQNAQEREDGDTGDNYTNIKGLDNFRSQVRGWE